MTRAWVASGAMLGPPAMRILLPLALLAGLAGCDAKPADSTAAERQAMRKAVSDVDAAQAEASGGTASHAPPSPSAP